MAIDQPIRITVNGDVSGLNFPVEHLESLPTETATAAAALDKRRSTATKPRRTPEVQSTPAN